MKKENLPILYVVTACLLLSFCHCPLFEIFWDDKEIFKYTGLVIERGGVPYRDFFDHKPPLIFFLNYYGQLMGPWGLWLIDTILVLTASISFVRVCRRYKLKHPWMLPVLFNVMIRYSIVSLGIGLTREYTTILLLIFFCIMLGQLRYKFYLLGLLSALIFLMQQDQIITVSPFVIYALIHRPDGDSRKRLYRFAQYCIGSLFILALIFFYFQIHHSLQYFWEDAFLFNTQWYLDKLPLIRHLQVLKHQLNRSEFDYIFYSTFILGATSLLLKHRKKRLLFVCLLSLILSFSAEYLSAKLSFIDCLYYFLPLAATIPILLFTVFSFSNEIFLQEGAPQSIFIAILSANLLLGTLRYVSSLTTEENYLKKTPEMEYLKKQTLHDYQYFAFGNSNYIYVYNEYKILCPTRWVYQHFYFWYPDWDKDFSIIKTITSGLESHKTTYVIDCSDCSEHRTMKNKAILKYWKDFLQEKYEHVKIDGTESLLWKWKGSQTMIGRP